MENGKRKKKYQELGKSITRYDPWIINGEELSIQSTFKTPPIPIFDFFYKTHK